jgi:hypothetical protein
VRLALFVYLPAPVDSGTSLDQMQRIATSRAAQLPPAKFTPVSRLTSFSPSIALRMPARRGPRFASLESTAAPAPAQAPIASDAQTGWQTTVVSAATPAPTEFAQRDPDARYKLIFDIQQQLRRVGCYWDRMDGSWGFATKDAMKEFTDRVNATLPLEEPDDVQLALIQSHSDKVCGACPAGQSLSASGRCVGLPSTAQAHTKRNAGPQVAAEQAPAQKEVLPWKTNAMPGAPAGQPLFKPVPTTVVSTEPLRGRMAIGGPIPTTVDAQQSAPPTTPGAAAAPPGTVTAALDPNAVAVKPPVVTAAPKAERRSSSSYPRARPGHRRRFAGNAPPQRYRSSHRQGPGSPHYNLMLSLGGVY